MIKLHQGLTPYVIVMAIGRPSARVTASLDSLLIFLLYVILSIFDFEIESNLQYGLSHIILYRVMYRISLYDNHILYGSHLV